MVPSVAELLDGARVVALPLVTRFRGIEVREAMLLRGPNGWTEFSPFLEYDDAESSAWLAAAIDFGWGAETPTAEIGLQPWQFEGDFGSDSVWNLLNQYKLGPYQ